MILKPLILVLVINEVGEKFPIARSVLCAFNHKIVSIITEIRHGLHTDNCRFYVFKLLIAQSIWSNWYLGVTDFKDSFLLRANQLDSLPITANSNALAGLVLMQIILIILLNRHQRGWGSLWLEILWVFLWGLLLLQAKQIRIKRTLQAELFFSFLPSSYTLLLLLILSQLVEVAFLNQLLSLSCNAFDRTELGTASDRNLLLIRRHGQVRGPSHHGRRLRMQLILVCRLRRGIICASRWGQVLSWLCIVKFG